MKSTVGKSLKASYDEERLNPPLAKCRCVNRKLQPNINRCSANAFAEGVDLSGGEWQKIALAVRICAMALCNPGYEPAASLGLKQNMKCSNDFRVDIRPRPRHHFAPRTVRMADRILVLRKGEMLSRSVITNNYWKIMVCIMSWYVAGTGISAIKMCIWSKPI